jgi:hypothetical protein
VSNSGSTKKKPVIRRRYRIAGCTGIELVRFLAIIRGSGNKNVFKAFAIYNQLRNRSCMKNADKPFLGIIIVSIILLYSVMAMIS